MLLTNDTGLYLIHSLTTTQNNLSVPGLQYGCSVHNHVPYYFFPAGHSIGDQDFAFDKDSFIFFRNNVRKELYSKFEAATKTLFGLVHLGTLSAEELKRIIKCALKSRFIAQDIEAELTAFKATL